MDKKLLTKAAAFVFAMSMLPAQQVMAATTGLDFAGGCPESSNGVTALCDGGSNADVNNVAAILGVNTSLVTQIAEVTGGDGTVNGLTIGGMNTFDGTWSISDPSITHIAFKSDGYFILGEVTAMGGTWDNADWTFSLAICPDTICTPGPRAYTSDDFTTNGGPIAALSNARAFAVVPVPAAVWLFGSGLLGLVGIARRRRS